MRHLTCGASLALFLALSGIAALLFPVERSAAAARPSIPNQRCLDCHADAAAVSQRYLVNAAKLRASPHTEENGVSCVSCHVRAAGVKDITDHGRLGPASCDDCHDAGPKLKLGIHGPGRRVSRAATHPLPSCASCHERDLHGVKRVSDAASPMSSRNQIATCGACHGGEMIRNFEISVHGRELASGSGKGPTCSTCHRGHDTPRADQVHNPIFKEEMVARCGSCHARQLKEYADSVHGTALVRDKIYDAASCVDCHLSHKILPPKDPRSSVHPTKVVHDCARCHADARLIRRLHLPADVVQTFISSYHGQASELGDARVANCSSCHEHHAIYRTSDPRSSVHPNNLQKSCGKCHAGASRNFIQGKIHIAAGARQNYAAWVVKQFYIWAIAILITSMLLHNLLDFRRKMKDRMRARAGQPHVIRMDRQERLGHLAVLVSFAVLAYTGFGLLYPGAWWMAPMNWISGTEAFRKAAHRGAGVVLTLVMFQHLYFLFFTGRGREQRQHFLPGLRDVREAGQNILYFLGRRRERPAFDRFGYIEKAEYWALVWGTVVMTLTGYILWFEGTALRFMPRSLWEVFLVVHRYEAILAVLAILVWHFYFVFVNPDEAPMSTVWLNGRMTLEDLSKQHPDEFARLEEQRREELARGDAEADPPARQG